MFDPKTIDTSKITYGELKSPGMKFVKRNIVDIKNIYNEPVKSNNPTRSKGKSLSHIQQLEQSLSRGIDYSKQPPIVIRNVRNENGVITENDIIAGMHRYEALLNLGMECWVFDEYEYTGENGVTYEEALRTFQLLENNKAPSLASTEDDVVKTVTILIAHGSTLVKPTEDSIKEYVETVCSYKHHLTKAKIVRDIVRNLQKSGMYVYSDTITYTPADVTNFLVTQTDLKNFGEFDFVRNRFGWSVLEGYENELLSNAIKRFGDTNKGSYFVLHTKSPTETSSVQERRSKMVNNFKTMEKNLLKVFQYYQEHNEFPWNIEGFLPQDIAGGEKQFIALNK